MNRRPIKLPRTVLPCPCSWRHPQNRPLPPPSGKPRPTL